MVPQRPATGPAALVGAGMEPPQPFTGPDLFDLREGTQKKRRPRTGTALVRKNKGRSLLMYLALAGAAVAGFFAVVHFFPHGSDAGDQVAASPAQPGRANSAASGSGVPVATAATAPGDTAAGGGSGAGSDVAANAAGSTTEPGAGSNVAAGAGSNVAAGAGSNVAAVTSPQIATSGRPASNTSAAVAHATGHDSGAHHTTAVTGAGTAGGGPVVRPESGASHDAVKTGTAQDAAKTGTAQDAAKASGPPTPPADSDGCDEVTCVMDHYEKACCARFKPADGGFHPKGTVPDQLDKAMVKAGIENVKPKVVACGEKIAAKGTVKLSISVGPEGNVKDISVAEAPDPGLGDCVLGAVKHAQFAKSVNGASFTYPFVF